MSGMRFSFGQRHDTTVIAMQSRKDRGPLRDPVLRLDPGRGEVRRVAEHYILGAKSSLPKDFAMAPLAPFFHLTYGRRGQRRGHRS